MAYKGLVKKNTVRAFKKGISQGLITGGKAIKQTAKLAQVLGVPKQVTKPLKVAGKLDVLAGRLLRPPKNKK